MTRALWLLPLALVACGEKKPLQDSQQPPTGWSSEEGMMGECYYPPDFSAMTTIDRKLARGDVLDHMMSQWNGSRDDGVKFEPRVLTNVENQLLLDPVKIEEVVLENYDLCKTAMTGGGTDEWTAWLTRLPHRLSEGKCQGGLAGTMYNYLELGMSWQFEAPICKDETVQVTASSNDFYRTSNDGPWVNADGNKEKSAAGGNYLCATESCYDGQLVMRFRGESGRELIVPIGVQDSFQAPENGTIAVSINDTDFTDNAFKNEGGVTHHTQLTYTPVD